MYRSFRSVVGKPAHAQGKPVERKTKTMKRAYELALIVRMDANQAVIDEAVEQVQTWVTEEDQGEIIGIDRWGQRRLAYEIDNQRDGYYVFIRAAIEPHALAEIEENLKFANSILRYLLVRDDDEDESDEE